MMSKKEDPFGHPTMLSKGVPTKSQHNKRDELHKKSLMEMFQWSTYHCLLVRKQNIHVQTVPREGHLKHDFHE
jgi:hypothetical protein